MKKIISLLLALTLLLGILAVPAMADSMKVGTLSYLNLTEENGKIFTAARRPLIELLVRYGVMEGEKLLDDAPAFRLYDSLNAMLMALQSGEVDAIKVPYYTGKYLCSTNDGLKPRSEYHPEKATGAAAKLALGLISDGYSFMLKEENTELRDAFSAQIAAMKEDGTLQQLIDEHIIKAAETGEPVAIAFEQFEGDPIKVAVTGSLPPMDYVAADGSFAGFNTAVLAEIGKRLQKNIQLVQVDSVGRALALSEGTVDVVFWTRGMSEIRAERHSANGDLSEEEQEARKAESRESMAEEDQAFFDANKSIAGDTKEIFDTRDLPAGTIITQPYFSDFPSRIELK